MASGHYFPVLDLSARSVGARCHRRAQWYLIDGRGIAAALVAASLSERCMARPGIWAAKLIL